MPFETKFDEKTNLVMQVGTGFVKTNDVKQAFEQCVSEPDFTGSTKVILDLREAIVDVTPKELHDMMHHVATIGGGSGRDYRLAFLIKERLAALLTDIFTRLAASLSFDVDIFTDYDKALNWATQPG